MFATAVLASIIISIFIVQIKKVLDKSTIEVSEEKSIYEGATTVYTPTATETGNKPIMVGISPEFSG